MPSPYISDPTDPNLLQFMQSLIAAQQQGGGGGGGYPISQAATNVEVDPVIMAQRMGRVTGAQNERAARMQQRRELELLEARANIEAQGRAQEQSFAATQADLDRQARASEAAAERTARSGELATRISADERMAKMDLDARNVAAARLNALNLQIQVAQLKAAQVGGPEQEEALQQIDTLERQLNDYQDRLTAAQADVERSTPEARKQFEAHMNALESQATVHNNVLDSSTAGMADTLAQHIADSINSTTSGMGYTPMSGVETGVSGVAKGIESVLEFLGGRDKVSDVELLDALGGGGLSTGVLAAYTMSQPESAGRFIGRDKLTEVAGADFEYNSRKWASDFIEQGLVRSLGNSGQNINIAAARPHIQALMSKLAGASVTPNLKPEDLRKEVIPLVQAIAREGFPGAEMGKQDYTPIVADVIDTYLDEASKSLRAYGTNELSKQAGSLNLAAVRGGALQYAGNEANKMRFVLNSALTGAVLNRKALTSSVAAMKKALAPEGGDSQIAVLREVLKSQPDVVAPSDLVDLLAEAERSAVAAKEAGVKSTEAEKRLARERARLSSQVSPRVERQRSQTVLAEMEKLLAEQQRTAQGQ